MIERMIDIAADELKIDPIELRRRNYISPQQMPFKTGLTFTYDCGEFEKNMDMALELHDSAGFKRRRENRADAANYAVSVFPIPSNARQRGVPKAPKCALTAAAA